MEWNNMPKIWYLQIHWVSGLQNILMMENLIPQSDQQQLYPRKNK